MAVVATALGTEFGKTFQEMKDVEVRKTPLQIKMDELGKTLSIFSFGIIGIIGLVGMVQGKTFLSMFNIGVSLAVAAIPEGLPICVTVTLALGVMRMAKKNAIVKKLPAVEALGCANYICSDKTGTLTENKMTATMAYCPAMDDAVMLSGIPCGEAADMISNSDDTNISISRSSGELRSEKGCYENGKQIDIAKRPCLFQMFDAACVCNNAHVNGSQVIGQPTEGALLIAANALGVPDRRSTLKRISESGFTSETKKMEVRCKSEKDGKECSYVKGAVEVILNNCSSYQGQNNEGEVFPLNSAAKDRVLQHCEAMANDGLRVIAIASGSNPTQMIFCGVIGMMDPLRKGVVEVGFVMLEVEHLKATTVYQLFLDPFSSPSIERVSRGPPR